MFYNRNMGKKATIHLYHVDTLNDYLNARLLLLYNHNGDIYTILL